MVHKGDSNQIVTGALAGRSLDQMATAAGVSRSTIQRRLKDPAMREAIREERARLRVESFARLRELDQPAVRRLRALVDDEDPGVALRAIALFFTTLGKLDGVVDLEDRLLALEAAPLESEGTEAHAVY
jgi:AcrR family transcriptional regulator